MTDNKFDYEVVDNFLDNQTFHQIKNIIINNSDFPWFLCDGVSDINSNDGYYFFHMFYDAYEPCSDTCKIVEPILNKIHPTALIKIKANFYPTTKEIVHHQFHVDVGNIHREPISHNGCILYLNTNNGKTIFENGIEIDSIENRALFFDPSFLHQSTTCTDDKIGRFNINFNYF
jgi:hypothetical protein